MQQKKLIRIGIIAVVLIILSVWISGTQNTLIKKEEKVRFQWAEVQNAYQRRIDFIPNVVNVVKGLSDFEQGTLEKVATARANAIRGMSVSGEDFNRVQQLQDSLATSINRVIANIEAYPDLKGTSAYLGLQTQLEGTERRIKVARNDFNNAVADYNRKVRSFPANIIAGIFGFKRQKGFTTDAGTSTPVEIEFNKKSK